MGLSCSSKPGPTINGNPHSNRPFHELPLDAIVFFRVQVQSFDVMPLEDPIFFSVFIHRRSLLELCTSPTTPGTLHIPWDAWGAQVSRLLTSDVVVPQWLTATAGERYVALNGKTEIIVLDFNPARVKALAEQGYDNTSTDNGEDLSIWTERGTSCFIHGSLERPVPSQLPYACYKRKNIGPFDGILVDGERLLGLQVCSPISSHSRSA